MDFSGPKDGVVLIFSGHGVAGISTLSETLNSAADLVGIAVIPAPDFLTEIAADGG